MTAQSLDSYARAAATGHHGGFTAWRELEAGYQPGCGEGSRECVFGLPHTNTLQQTVPGTSAWGSYSAEMLTDHYLFLGIVLLGCLAVFLCV